MELACGNRTFKRKSTKITSNKIHIYSKCQTYQILCICLEVFHLIKKSFTKISIITKV